MNFFEICRTCRNRCSLKVSKQAGVSVFGEGRGLTPPLDFMCKRCLVLGRQVCVQAGWMEFLCRVRPALPKDEGGRENAARAGILS